MTDLREGEKLLFVDASGSELVGTPTGIALRIPIIAGVTMRQMEIVIDGDVLEGLARYALRLKGYDAGYIGIQKEAQTP